MDEGKRESSPKRADATMRENMGKLQSNHKAGTGYERGTSTSAPRLR